ncbi:uncharacterized protein LOC128986274 [Macrosteles quadrilineatus]|uniref:uncharacterized protein LOC128986274 n=1 Tax=Macrosteles quadrilineatus TaxID=74068 RepID=UPI0023E223C1|nr:uncharacterized protein LOC128986274 [Macrosteles quadrilineatus]
MPRFAEQTVIKRKLHADRLVLVKREEWEAREPKEPLPAVPLPIQYVVVTWTDTDICEWPAACMKRVKSIQEDHMDNKGLPDIRYNFLIGSDKQTYEGRGWRMMGPTYPETIEGAKEINGKSIEIAFIEKDMQIPSDDLASAMLKFLAKEMALNNVARPLEFKAIMDNKFVRFSRLFEGEKVADFMYTEEERAAEAERDQEAEEILKESLKELEERDSWIDNEMEAILEEQRAVIKTKTPEEIKKEYGYTEDVDEEKVRAVKIPDDEKPEEAEGNPTTDEKT